jgi:hypothetical protein
MRGVAKRIIGVSNYSKTVCVDSATCSISPQYLEKVVNIETAKYGALDLKAIGNDVLSVPIMNNKQNLFFP